MTAIYNWEFGKQLNDNFPFAKSYCLTKGMEVADKNLSSYKDQKNKTKKMYDFYLSFNFDVQIVAF